VKPVLIDSSIIVAVLDRGERYHKDCVSALREIDAPLITCEAVIAESCYLLRAFPKAVVSVLENVRRGAFGIGFDLSLSALRIQKLISKYSDIPMDFADACLVCMAEDFNTGDILTLDGDFSIYRWNSRRQFNRLITCR
jgi:uncharacterized protein